MAKPAFTMEQALILRERYENGATTVTLANEYGVRDSCIANWIKKAGGVIRTNSQSKRKFTFNEHFWDMIDTENKAYWLGFFMADGYIGAYKEVWRNFWCTLAAKDGHHLEQFLKDIDATYEIKYYARLNKKTGNVHQKCRICLTSIPFVQHLIDIGWHDFKNDGDLRLFESVPEELHNHFVRGFFDGDGSIGRYRRKDRKIMSLSYSVTIVAPFEHEKFLDEVRRVICYNAAVKDKPLKHSKTVLRCHWNGNQQLLKIKDWMYSGATVFLQRKKARFDSITKLVRFDWPTNNLFTCSHTPSAIAALDRVDQDLTIDQFCQLIQATQWVAPSYSDEQLLADYRSIVLYNSDLHVVREDGQLQGFRLNTGGNAESPGKKIVLNFQPHFWNTKTTAPTIPQQWHNKSLVKRAATALLTTGTKVTFWRYLRELRYAGAGVTSHFHPNFAISIIKQLAPDAQNWFDPCMGWGGRLIASMILDMQYEGCDPQPNTFQGLSNIKKFLSIDQAVLHNKKAQDFVFSRNYDLGFTSPPFFNKEKYGGQEQSYNEFTQFDVWMTGFMCPLVDKMLLHCGRVILHVDARIADALEKLYSVIRYPLYLQRNPGGPVTAEAVLLFCCD